MSPTWFLEESTPSTMRIRMDCPAGMVTSPPGPTLAAAGAGAGAGAGGGASGAGAGAAIGVAPPPRPVKVKATMSLVLKVCISPFTSKRRMAAVPPRYRPCTTLPLFNSKVSAAATLTKNNTTAMAAKKRFTLRILPSLIADSQSHASRTSPKGRSSTILLHWIRSAMEWLREKRGGPHKETGPTPVTLAPFAQARSEEHTSELQSHVNLVC